MTTTLDVLYGTQTFENEYEKDDYGVIKVVTIEQAYVATAFHA